MIMTKDEWKKKYDLNSVGGFGKAPVTPENVLAAAKHSLGKWKGLREENFYGTPEERKDYIRGGTCALCFMFYNSEAYDEHHDGCM
jgi:hypothetical protein